MPATTPRRWAGVTEAARYSGYTTRTIRQRIKDGDLPAYTPRGSRLLRVDLNDVDEMITGEGARESLAARIRRILADRGDDLPDLTDEQIRLAARLLPPLPGEAGDDAA